MGLTWIAVTLAGVATLALSGLVWVGKFQIFDSSIRWNHTGVLFSSGVFLILTSFLWLVSDDSFASFSIRMLSAGSWLLSFIFFLWMFLQTPNKWSSRMAWKAEKAFEQDPGGNHKN
jgi:hypothetical protein